MRYSPRGKLEIVYAVLKVMDSGVGRVSNIASFSRVPYVKCKRILKDLYARGYVFCDESGCYKLLAKGNVFLKHVGMFDDLLVVEEVKLCI